MKEIREIEELTDEERQLEDRRTKVKDYKEHSLTTEERDEIIRKYNADHSIHSITADVVDRSDDDDIAERTLSEHERADILQEIDGEQLSEDGRDELVRRINGNSKSRARQLELSSQSKLNPRESQETKEWEVNMWEPQITGTLVDSEEQVMTILQELIPGILKHQRFETLRHQISMHMKAIQEFSHRNRVTYGEINDFAKQNDYPSSTIEAWVLQGVQPNSFRIINENALTIEKAEILVSEMREKLHGLDTQVSLDKCLDTPHHEMRTKTLPYFKKDYENACGFYRFLDELVDGGVISDIARRVGIPRLDARRYVEEKSIPRLIRKVLNQPLDEIEAIKEKLLIQDEVQYDLLLCRHPQILDVEDFNDMDRHMRGYLRLKKMQLSDSLPDVSQEVLADMLGISGSRLNLYLSDKSTPKLQFILLLYEDMRLRYEGKLSPLAFENRIEPELVFNELHQYKDSERIDTDTFSTSLRTIYEKTAIPAKVRWLDLYRYTPSGQEWFKEIVNYCAKDRSKIERVLNQQLGFDKDNTQRLRLGVVSSRIYLRLEDTQETDWMQFYNDEMFHFHSQECIDDILSKAKAKLDIKGDISLSRLVHQVTDYDKSVTSRGMNSDLHFQASYIKGSTLSLLLDSCDLTIQDIQENIVSIGRIDRRLIRNPRFSDDALEIDKAFARLFGAGLSDGHIDQFRVFCYAEANVDRINIFQNHVRFFGDVDYTREIDENGTSEIRYSAVLGKLLEKRGFTVGDKTVQNRGIPDFILNGPIEVQVEYLKQLWPEDGEFVNTDDEFHKYFRWTRAVALIDPQKDARYSIDRNFTQEMLQFIHDYGTYKEDSSFQNKEFYPRFILTRADLTKYLKCANPIISNMARKISSFIEMNKSTLMADEQNLARTFGVDTWSACTEITHYLETGRVSAMWRARTKSLDDTMRVAIMAPPDDIRKSTLVHDWIQSELVRYRRIMRELETQGHFQRTPNPSNH